MCISFLLRHRLDNPDLYILCSLNIVECVLKKISGLLTRFTDATRLQTLWMSFM